MAGPLTHGFPVTSYLAQSSGGPAILSRNPPEHWHASDFIQSDAPKVGGIWAVSEISRIRPVGGLRVRMAGRSELWLRHELAGNIWVDGPPFWPFTHPTSDPGKWINVSNDAAQQISDDLISLLTNEKNNIGVILMLYKSEKW